MAIIIIPFPNLMQSHCNWADLIMTLQSGLVISNPILFVDLTDVCVMCVACVCVCVYF